MTVAKYLNRVPDCDILIVDECSTVCNSDMKSIIDSNRFKLLLLVGDVRQIESIKFGNWFSLALISASMNLINHGARRMMIC